MHVTFTVAPCFKVFAGVPVENALTAGWSEKIKVKLNELGPGWIQNFASFS